VTRMQRRFSPTSLIAGAALAVAAATFTSPGLAAEPPEQGPEVWEYLASLGPEKRLEVMEEQAKREGSFVIYGALGIDRAEILSGFDIAPADLDAMLRAADRAFEGHLRLTEDGLFIPPEARPLTRMIARAFDAYDMAATGHSTAV